MTVHLHFSEQKISVWNRVIINPSSILLVQLDPFEGNGHWQGFLEKLDEGSLVQGSRINDQFK